MYEKTLQKPIMMWAVICFKTRLKIGKGLNTDTLHGQTMILEKDIDYKMKKLSTMMLFVLHSSFSFWTYLPQSSPVGTPFFGYLFTPHITYILLFPSQVYPASYAPLYFSGFCGYSMLYTHIWGLGARNHRRKRFWGGLCYLT